MSSKYKHGDRVPTSVLAERLSELSKVVASGPLAVSREFVMSIPAQLDRDADLVLSASARRLIELDESYSGNLARLDQEDIDTFSRQSLIEICESAVVSQEKWDDRDTSSAQLGIGKAWALLKSGCEYRIDPETDAETIWIQFFVRDFSWFENCDDEKGLDSPDYRFYLPTEDRLKQRSGKDWY